MGFGTQLNVETLHSQQQQANLTLQAFDAMQAGQMRLAQQQQMMTVESIEQLHENIHDCEEELQAVGEALGQHTSLGVAGTDDYALEQEFAKMQQDMVAEAQLRSGMPA